MDCLFEWIINSPAINNVTLPNNTPIGKQIAVIMVDIEVSAIDEPIIVKGNCICALNPKDAKPISYD